MPDHSVSILSTGDELLDGDIVNTNVPLLSQKLLESGLALHYHLTARDDLASLESALRYLMQHSRAILTTGGLGPTSDDLTRFAVAHVAGKALVEHAASWDRIVARYKKKDRVPPVSNKQQVLFPADATVYANDHGTADACCIQTDTHNFYLLPGPPRECMPIFDAHVLPALTERYGQPMYRFRAVLKGCGEAAVAEILDALTLPTSVKLGYRSVTPYLEVKCLSSSPEDLETAICAIEPHISAYRTDESIPTT